MFAVYFLLLVLPLISAQVYGNGRCPVPLVQQNFCIQGFLGRWFEVARIPSRIGQGACVKTEYKIPRGTSFTAEHSQFINGRFSYSTGTIRVGDQRDPAKLEIQFSSGPFRPFWVLQTDYVTYAVVYTCEEHQNTHGQYAWVLGRQPYVHPYTLHGIINALVHQGIYGNKMEITDQSCYTDIFNCHT